MRSAHGLALLCALLCAVASLSSAARADGGGGRRRAHGASAGRAAAAASRPNIMLIITDDQRWDEFEYMPNVRKLLIKQGTSFSNAFDAFPVCCPARATLLTGQYAHNHHVIDNLPGLGWEQLNRRTTINVALQRAGYSTNLMGKYLNDWGIYNATSVPPGWDDFRTPTAMTVNFYYNAILNENGHLHNYTGTYQTDYTREIVLRRLEELKNGGRPWYYHVSFNSPHAGSGPGGRFEGGAHGVPYAVPSIALNNTLANVSQPRRPNFNEADYSDKSQRFVPLMTPEIVAEVQTSWQRRQEALISVDQAIATIVAKLRATGQLDNTVIIFTSDNGYMLGEHRIPQSKGYLYEEGIRAPIVVSGPGVARGVVRSQLVSHIDIAPTILNLARATPLAAPDGRALAPLLHGAPKWSRNALLIEASFLKHAMVRTHKWAYISAGALELYDMINDPYQLNNITAQVPIATRNALAARLARLRACKADQCRVADSE